jgi:phosphoserine phosphatase
MVAGKTKLLGKYALESFRYFLKRNFSRLPEKVSTIVVDVDYTLLEALTAYRALEKILGPEGARAAYSEQKARVKSGKANFADVKKWGHDLQVKQGWTARDWKRIVDEGYAQNLFNNYLVAALTRIKTTYPDIRIVLTTGTSDVLGRRLAAHLRARYGLRVDAVIGSQQTFEKGKTGKVQHLVRFVGETHTTIPTIEKMPAIREHFRQKGWTFNPKTTMSISDADPELLRRSGVGVLMAVGKSQDPSSYVSQKFKLRDVEIDPKRSMTGLELLAANPRRSIGFVRKESARLRKAARRR